ncbi:hypothetical protein ACXR8U_23510 [Methylobacterium radiotolerans]|jgi:hypothetical protein|uniref:hypothetical protein n=1 Tax=Methylobacterium radiotolerans TaxID=31998 RepID=UPI000B775E95|nr:hypothetical protein [Methylobacterium radiotolerans]OXE42031.1 hypothetical protein CCS92_09910 [Methylobacterium radiotolerans]
MKRRSARPFMVEVKQTRSARTTLTATEARPRPDKILWPELAQAALEPPAPAPAPQAAPAPRPERKVPDAPVRRVLPSLMPMFDVPVEPVVEVAGDAVTEPAAETVPAPRARRGRPRAAARDALPQGPTAPPPRPAAPPAPLPAPPVDEAPAGIPPAATGQATGQGPSPRSTAGRRTNELRLGERWKRRLPQFMR